MPATWDLPRSSGLWNQQDIANYNRLPIWMAMQQTKKMQMWSRWKDMFPKIKWKQNMGDILQGVIAENSPIVTQVHRPKNITELPLKTVAFHAGFGSVRYMRFLFSEKLGLNPTQYRQQFS